ncbi:MAG: thermonuclease family protein, partial [Acidimicrobiia bacterium]
TDGVTIRVLVPDGSEEPVRLIGIDAPEDGSLLDQKATAFLEGLALEEEVRLLIDVNDRDRLGRLLRYVYVDDVFVNEEMVRAGMAIAKRYEPDTAMASILKAAQSGAEQASLGLFSADLTTTTVAPTTTSLTVATTTSTTIAVTITTVPPQAGCDPSYPDFCIPSPPPDVDCGDIGYKNFTVHSPDPHSFDGNNDGVGCES